MLHHPILEIKLGSRLLRKYLTQINDNQTCHLLMDIVLHPSLSSMVKFLLFLSKEAIDLIPGECSPMKTIELKTQGSL
jgi:hypothetical protein